MTMIGTGAVVLALTLHGEPIPVVVDVYRLAAPVVEPQQQTADPAPSSHRRATLAGTLIGATTGCAVGAAAGDTDNSKSGNCLIWGGVGAALGAIAGRSLRRP